MLTEYMEKSMHLGIILSMKKGIDHFVYRELLVYTSQNTKITLFPTKYRLGLYNAIDQWTVQRWYPIWVILLQPFFFLQFPIKYTQLLTEAIKEKLYMDFLLAWYFSRKMRNVDVIYSICGDHKFFVGYFCKRILKKPLAVTIHAYELYRNPNPGFFVKALNNCDQIITVTQYNKEILSSRYGIDSSKIRVVRVGVDTQDYHPGQKFTILIVGYFDERKGHDLLFKAVKQLGLDDIEIWVVGTGDQRGGYVDVYRLANDIGIQNHVAFFGEISGNALKAVYRNCDIFCLPCRKDRNGISEGFPTVLMEAMAFGKPVISSRHVEIPRIISEILIDENDVDGLAEAIMRLYKSRQLREIQGENNRKIAEELFSLKNAECIHELLKCLSNNKFPNGQVLSGKDK